MVDFYGDLSGLFDWCNTQDMSRRVKNRLALIGGGAASLLIVGTFVFLLWIKDVRNDRKHIVIVNTATPVFVGTGDEGGCHGTQLTTPERGSRLPVRRIRYLKDCATIDVALPDGREGYVVLGVGDISVNPPLPTT
jgi:hypothetical protein